MVLILETWNAMNTAKEICNNVERRGKMPAEVRDQQLQLLFLTTKSYSSKEMNDVG